jgi:hypothetical protein
MVIPSETLNGLASDFLTAFSIKLLKIGSAVFDPVSNLPRGDGLSIPTYTPITRFEVKPMNQVSVFSFVVDSKGMISDINDRIQVKIRPKKPGEMSNFIDGNGNRALRRVPSNGGSEE